MVADLAVAQAFYGAVLGWRFRSSSLDEDFVVATAGGDPVAGIGTRRPGLAPVSEWTPYFAVRDADATAARIRERGATVAVGPMALGDGRVGLAADQDGDTFGTDARSGPGAWADSPPWRPRRSAPSPRSRRAAPESGRRPG
ncbi:VOC family protein [Streptomyces anulatus]